MLVMSYSCAQTIQFKSWFTLIVVFKQMPDLVLIL